jgi:hypothetical protein
MRAEAVEPSASHDDFEVWADCWEAFVFFARDLAGEWSFVSGMTTMRVGIPSDRIEAVMRLKPVPPRQRAQLYADVKVMERAALEADRKLASKKE